jgi:hypothetical protein
MAVAASTGPFEPAELKRFQERVEQARQGIRAFSFGRDGFRSPAQQQGVIRAIREVHKKPAELRRVFTFNPIKVPDCLRERHEETLLEIRLRDDVTAAAMVFRDQESKRLAKPVARAWEIYSMLFAMAESQKLIDWPDSSPDSEKKRPLRYCPTALIGRFLEIAYRLRPADCVSIPVRMNDGRSLFLHLPKVPEKSRCRPQEVQAAARYVPAWVLNQIMMQEVTSCQVALEDLKESEEGKFWFDHIQAENNQNHYEILFHSYLSHYLAEPRQVLLDQGHVDLLPTIEAHSADPGSEVHALLQALKKTGGKESGAIILGIDVGGTFVKMRFYQVEEGKGGESRLKSLGRDVRMLTASSVPLEEKKPQVNLDRFLDRLSERIQLEIESLGLQEVHAVGVSWPGPVRRQRIQGTSGILKKLLGLSLDIAENDIGTIMRMDIVGGLAKRLFAKNDGPRCAVTLINDGNAHALGVLAEAYIGRRLKSGRDAELGVVVKAGTGTAGAVILNGLPASGLMEFGKLVVNLAYWPVDSPQFPQGVARDYCSRQTLPSLMGIRLKHLEGMKPPIESIEVGRLAELAQAIERGDEGEVRKVLRQLIWDSGKIAVAGLLVRIDPELDVVALEELSSRWGEKSHLRLQLKVTQYLALSYVSDEEGIKVFRERIQAYGEHRLLQIVNAQTNDRRFLRQLWKDRNSADLELRKNLPELENTAKTAFESTRSLGRYIGDLLSLLFHTHQMKYAVLGGGVLSGTTGRLAREAAIERLNKYNEIDAKPAELAGNLGVRFLDGQDPVAPAAEHDPGTLGAALAGALELLRQKRLEGLKRIIQMVHRLELMKTIEISDTEVKAQDVQPLLSPEAHALDAEIVRHHLDQAAPRLGLVRTLTEDRDKGKGRKYTYTRWLAG